jgi:hypothetical protein
LISPRTSPFWPATGTILRTYVVLSCPDGLSDASVASPSPDRVRVWEPAPTYDPESYPQARPSIWLLQAFAPPAAVVLMVDP